MEKIQTLVSPVYNKRKLKVQQASPAGGDAPYRVKVPEGYPALADHPSCKQPRVLCSPKKTHSDNASLPFPQKLWKVVESGKFQSVTWDPTGNCVVINKELIKNEIAERKAPVDMFGWSSLKSFQRQLQLYGFRQTRLSQQTETALERKVRNEVIMPRKRG
ncbi:heat shock transcription factor, Y-linked-like [Erpetoichthys calabaricus]|uniref:heat shock transcription factor, Y-linked-like n=1 Tax=Erpetoichthys calabaricus TaxID=27687 RepID=UPI002234256A|nr:heat shock transcription factor, Y-linked-like [Erpetoichthys calabaricus]